ncbi:MAG: LysM peptidoglycan-binding domain-containing protein [Bacillota bacterium]
MLRLRLLALSLAIALVTLATAGAQAASYTVASGDTLWRIAIAHQTTVDELRSRNGLSTTTIYPGQRLEVPPYERRHTVQAGETLWKIAQTYSTTVEALQAANRLNGTLIYPGQILLIPATARPAPPGTMPQLPGVTLYWVRSGDTLWGLARAYRTSQEAISRTNALRSEILMPGQPLYLPVGSTQPVEAMGPRGPQSVGFGELLDWSAARWIYNVGSMGTAIDLATRQSFNIRHLGGSNHADSEPLSPRDTAIMKEIFGGWTWSARPILLKTNGRLLAASMSAMPHGVQTIYDNGFDGHFDLYFYNSRSHVSGSLSPQHQANVLRAAGR